MLNAANAAVFSWHFQDQRAREFWITSRLQKLFNDSDRLEFPLTDIVPLFVIVRIWWSIVNRIFDHLVFSVVIYCHCRR